jgi:UMF1 family MFS transporter
MKLKMDRGVWGWGFYDWANSAFACTIMAAFFPVFFKKYWAAGMPATESTFYLGTTMSIAAALFAACAPVLGSFADLYGYAKRGVVTFMLLGVISCFVFFFIPKGDWGWALVVYALGWIGFTGGNLFYDSLLLSVSDDKNVNWVSSFGYSLGFLGGGLLIVVNAMMVTQPEIFGLADAAQGVKWAFITVGAWWLIFSLPLIAWVRERQPVDGDAPVLNGFREVYRTLLRIKNNDVLLLYLIAYFFYIDGVHTMFKLAVDFGLSIGLESGDLIKAIVIVQFVSFPATIVFSSIAKRTSTRKAILGGVFVYGLVCSLGVLVTTAFHFYILAVVIGLVQGGVQALSRALYASLIPSEQNSAEYFGFYNMFGKFSAILGPFLVGMTTLITDNSRYALFAILILFVIGGYLLWRVPESQVQQEGI